MPATFFVRTHGMPAASLPARDARLRCVRAWLVPDLALALTAVTLLYLMLLFGAGEKLFRDSDAGWHIRIGERMLAGGGLPTTDPFSFTKAAAPWVAWEWLADVAMGAMHQADGLRGVALLYTVLIGACTWLWVRLNWAVGGTFLVTAGMALPMLSTANLHWLGRPHVFSWVLALSGLLWLEKRQRSGLGVGELVAIGLIGSLWANLHASFALGFVFLCFYAVAAGVAPLVWKVPLVRAEARTYWAFALAFLAGTFINPYGWHLHRHIVAYLGNSELLARIGEFQSFNFHAEGAGQILLGVLLAAAGLVACLAQGRLAHALIIGALLAGALRSARGLPLLALIALPLANGAIAAGLQRLGGLKPAAQTAVAGALQYSTNLRALERNAHGLAWVPVLMLLCAACLSAQRVGFPRDQFPVEAARHLPPQARLLAPDKFGGYLIYASNGQRKVFFDGRSDFYGVEFMKEYIALVEVRPGWERTLARYSFTHALLPNNYSLIPALEQRGWRVTHRDGTATLLESAVLKTAELKTAVLKTAVPKTTVPESTVLETRKATDGPE